MPDSREYDVRYLSNLELPYDISTKELSDASPRLVAGANTYITLGGKIAQAPGLSSVGGFNTSTRPDRLVSYETLENPPKVFLIASLYSSGTGKWSCWYLRIDDTLPVWTSMGSYRDLDASTRPHEIICARGLCFIKSFPGAAGNKYGSVIFDGSGTSPVVRPWGIPWPSGLGAPNLYDASVYPWAASVQTFSVLFGWRYAACFESPTGQLSNHNPIDIFNSSAGALAGKYTADTGAFATAKPSMLLYTSGASTTEYPYINIYRTTDGGGTFYFLDRVANAGGVTQVYTDNKRDSTNTDNPKLDGQLDTSNIAPSLVSNTVPPPVSKGHVIGTDQVESSTPIAYYARRMWYGIGNRLYYSGQEEILNGIPEESFPSPNGITGNFYLFQGQLRQVTAVQKGLVVGTSDEINIITGQDKTNFFPETIANDISVPASHPHATVSFRDSLFFLGSDLQVYRIRQGKDPEVISGPLDSSLRMAINSQTQYECQFEIFSRDGYAWLIVNLANRDGVQAAKQFVYDINRGFWFTPWTKPISAMCFGKLRETDAQKHLIVLTWESGVGKLCVLDSTVAADNGTGFVPSGTTNLFTVPAGNHINELRRHGHFPVLSYLTTERTKFTSDHDLTISYRLDEFSGSSTTATATDPPYSVQHTSHIDQWYPVQKACQRVQLSFTGTSGEKMELQNIGFIFQSEAGA